MTIKSMEIATKFKGKGNPRVTYKGSGKLYLTSGGRIVLDCGWGEYFTEPSDTVIMTLDELRHGLTKEGFIKKIREAKKRDQTVIP